MKRSHNRRTADTILWIECVGFALIILLSWVDELLGLPHLLFGGVTQPNWRESALESLVTVTVWLFVYTATRRVLRRFRYLEELLTMCGWCRKLKSDGKWFSVEDYCSRELGVDISHGICPGCGRRLLKGNEEPAAEPTPTAID